MTLTLCQVKSVNRGAEAQIRLPLKLRLGSAISEDTHPQTRRSTHTLTHVHITYEQKTKRNNQLDIAKRVQNR